MAFQYEFFGPWGTAVFTVLTPVTIYMLSWASSTDGCLRVFPLSMPPPLDAPVFSWTGVGIVYGWFGAMLALHALLPAQQKQGIVEPDGKRWTYRLNGVPHTSDAKHALDHNPLLSRM